MAYLLGGNKKEGIIIHKPLQYFLIVTIVCLAACSTGDGFCKTVCTTKSIGVLKKKPQNSRFRSTADSLDWWQRRRFKLDGMKPFTKAELDSMSNASVHKKPPQIFQFPLPDSSVKSPDGNYLVMDRAKADSPYISSAVVLKNLRTGDEDTLMLYERHLDVLWSPDSRSIAITDYAGSDFSDCLIFRVDSLNKMIDVRSEMGTQEISNKHIWGNHHVYVKAENWINENLLKIMVYGYGDIDPHGFDLWYIYDLRSGVREIKK